jgi:Fe2+ transport system protein FeoA
MDGPPTLRTLADLTPGSRARIAAIQVADSSVERLMVMGLVEGAEIEFLRSALGGDPVEVKVHGAAISLRRDQARCFEVVASPSHG